MKILVLGINYYPELTGISVYTSDMCEYLAAAGHEVEVVTGFPYYPQWEVFPGYRGKVYASEEVNGVTIRRCYVYTTKKLSSLKRIIHEASFIVSSFFRSLFVQRPDILLVVSPPLGLGLSGYVLSRLKRVPLIFHVQDLQPDAAVGLGMLKKGKLTRFLYAVEKFIYKKARMVTTISKSMREKTLAKGIAPEKVELLPNWATLEPAQGDDHSASFREEFGLEGKFVFLYSGNVGKKQGLETLIEAFSDIEDSNAVCLIVGEGANIAALKERAKQAAVANIRFLPLQPKERLLSMLRAADVCLVIQKTVVSDIVFPSKMTNIMAAGCASLVTAEEHTELAQAVIESDSGYVALPENVESLRKKMVYALSDSSLSERRARAAAYAQKHLAKGVILKEFDALLKRIVN